MSCPQNCEQCLEQIYFPARYSNVLSLGYGASPDLAAFENYLHKNNFSIPVNYLGIDINSLWKDKHGFLTVYQNVESNTNIPVDILSIIF